MSVYSALTALNAQQTKLDVIGNNLANVSTIAYKGQSVSFADLLSQTLSGSTAASTTANTGGTNSQQVGLGVSVSGITTDVTSGSITSTGVDTDVAINGGGYFIVEGETAGTYNFTRAGNFSVDSSGNLTVNGYKVCGWEPGSSGTIDTETAVSAINLFYNDDGTSKQVIAPEASTYASVGGTLDSTTTAQGSALTSMNIAGATAVFTAAGTETVSGKLNPYETSATTFTVYNGTTPAEVGVDLSKGTTVSLYASGSTTASTYTQYTWTASDGTSGTLLFDSSGNIVPAATTLYSDAAGTKSVAHDTGKALATSPIVTLDFSTLTMDTTATAAKTDASTSIAVYDSLGNEYDVTVKYTKCYSTTVYDAEGNSKDITTVYWEASDASDNINATGSGYLAFDSDGKPVTGTYYSADPTSTTATTKPATYTFSTANDISITAATDSNGNKKVNIEDFTVAMKTTALSLYTEGAVTVKDSDGYASGTLTGYSISSDGTITGTYSNNQTQVLAQIGLAIFDNAAGLDKVGTSLYAVSSNSGLFSGAVVAGSDGTGTLTSGALESSNVDLSEQFAEMMVAERAYQAASKLITVTDDLSQTVINMVS